MSLARINVRDLGQAAGARKGIVTVSFGPFDATVVDHHAFICDQPYRLLGIEGILSVNGGTSAAVMPRKATGTQAPASGAALLSAAMDIDLLAANTKLVGVLSAAEASLRFAAGDRVALDFSGTLTGLVGLVLTAKLLPLNDRIYTLSGV